MLKNVLLYYEMIFLIYREANLLFKDHQDLRSPELNLLEFQAE